MMPLDKELSMRLLLEGWPLQARIDFFQNTVSRQQIDPLRSELLESAMGQWKAVVDPVNNGSFQKRLNWSGLNDDSLLPVISPSIDSIPQKPEWFSYLEVIIYHAEKYRFDGLEGIKFQNELPFAHAWWPVVEWALGELQERCQKYGDLSMSHTAWLHLQAKLLEIFCLTTDKALWDLFNRRRKPGQLLAAQIRARSGISEHVGRDVYTKFIVDLLQSGYRLLLEEFPVLGRHLGTLLRQWLVNNEEMLSRIQTARPDLEKHFSIKVTAPLVSIQQGLSDPHCGGRTVAILGFGSTEFQSCDYLVYKPKDLRVDAAYQLFLQTLNKLGKDEMNLAPLQTLEVISYQNYGFMEFLAHRPCKDDNELASFYYNAGRLLAVLYVLGCTDCHHENLIATSDNLVLIDTETLLEADIRDFVSEDPVAASQLSTAMGASVLRTGLLPNWYMGGGLGSMPMDFSALGIEPSPAEIQVNGWLCVNTDGMTPGKQTIPSPLPTSLPITHESPPRLKDFHENLTSGFLTQMNILITHRDILLEEIKKFSGLPRRLLTRHTTTYFRLQRQLLEPAALRSAFAQGLKLEQLSRSYLIAKEKPLNWDVFLAEIRQLERLDIPFFEHSIDGKDLPLPNELATVQDFMLTSGLEASLERLRSLNQGDIDFQQRLILGSIKARYTTAVHSSGWDNREKTNLNAPPDQYNLADEAYRLEATRLAELIWNDSIADSKGRPEWMGMDVMNEDIETFQFGLLSPSLYSGSAGIAILFSRLAEIHAQRGDRHGGEIWMDRTRKTLDWINDFSGSSRNDDLFRFVRDMPLGLRGTGGLILTLQYVGGYKEIIKKILEHLHPERLFKDHSYDLMVGVTGLIGPLLRYGSPHAQELALLCANHLLAHQAQDGGWPQPIRGREGWPSLTGFSHGASSIAAALAQVANVYPDETLLDSSRRALEYERKTFSESARNWPDFRASNEPVSFAISWCHGAPGIALGRLALCGTQVEDKKVMQEIHDAIEITLEALRPMASRHGVSQLCCGSLGLTSIIRILAQAGIEIPNSSLDKVKSVEGSIVEAAKHHAGRYLLFPTAEGLLDLPSLFTGSAGVALALLEAADGINALSRILGGDLINPNHQAKGKTIK